MPPCKDVTDPLTLTLSRKGRGDGYLGAMRSAYCTLPLTRKGEGMVTADDYASLIDPTRPNSTQFDPIRPYPLPQASTVQGGMGTAPRAGGKTRRGCNSRTLA